MKYYIFLIICLLGSLRSHAQNLFPATGSVGIGTLSPSLGLLHLNGSGADFISMSQTNPATPVQLNAYNNGDFRIVQRSMAPITFYTNTQEKMRIDQNGNVGIGVTNPSTHLDISGNMVLRNYTNAKGAGAAILFTSYADNSSPAASIRTYLEFAEGANSASRLILSSYNVGYRDELTLYEGRVGVNMINPAYTLDVNGQIHARGVLINTLGFPDFVFKKGFKLPPLSEVKAYIDQHQHLPEVPSEQEVIKNGLDVGEMNKLLMKKVEELTLYLIEKDTENRQQRADIEELKAQMKKILHNKYSPKSFK